jgi:hypothetical protein
MRVFRIDESRIDPSIKVKSFEEIKFVRLEARPVDKLSIATTECPPDIKRSHK